MDTTVIIFLAILNHPIAGGQSLLHKPHPVVVLVPRVYLAMMDHVLIGHD